MLGFVPMPHKVTIKKAGSLDDWGIAVEGQSEIVNARVSYNTNKQAITLTSGDSIVFTAKIILEGLPDVDYADTIVFTDIRGNVYSKKPLTVDYKHDLSGTAVAVSLVI